MISRNLRRKIRHERIRKVIFGTPERLRLNVYRSLKHIYAQIIDDTKGHTLVSASTLEPDIREQIKGLSKTEKAKFIGKIIAERAIAKGITKVVFDRGGYKYHGRVKALAEGAREGGLQF
ncbi:50S ribosomal protein L18 [bacterium]|nr:50S ribosomal protein L18 [bacterium]